MFIFRHTTCNHLQVNTKDRLFIDSKQPFIEKSKKNSCHRLKFVSELRNKKIFNKIIISKKNLTNSAVNTISLYHIVDLVSTQNLNYLIT